MKIDDLHLIFSWGHKNFVLKTPVNAELSSSPSPPPSPSPSPSPLLEVLSSQLSWPTWLLSIVGTDRGGMVSSSSSSPSWSNQLDFWALLEQIEEGWWASRWHSLSDELAPVLIPVKWLLRQKYILRGGFGAMSNMNKNILPLLTHEINIKTNVRSKKVNTKCITRTFCLGFPSSQLCCWQQPVWPNLSLRRRRVQNGQEDQEERGRNRKLSQSGDFHFCSPHLIL